MIRLARIFTKCPKCKSRESILETVLEDVREFDKDGKLVSHWQGVIDNGIVECSAIQRCIKCNYREEMNC